MEIAISYLVSNRCHISPASYAEIPSPIKIAIFFLLIVLNELLPKSGPKVSPVFTVFTISLHSSEILIMFLCKFSASFPKTGIINVP